MQVSEEIRDAVKIILARIETHPEDFEYGGKLHWITKNDPANERGLNAAEIAALALAVEKYNYGKFSRFVMESLLQDNAEPNITEPYSNPISAMNMKQQGSSLLQQAFNQAYANQQAYDNQARKSKK